MNTALKTCWKAYNYLFWDEWLTPCPIVTVGYLPLNQTQKYANGVIWILKGRSLQQQANDLLHCMVHQALTQSEVEAHHNSDFWCEEIVRVSAELGHHFWASPSVPRKIRNEQGKRISRRIQKRSPQGEPSISLKKIAQWPGSLGINAPLPD